MAAPLFEDKATKERRRLERRTNARLSDLTVPEMRRMLVTSLLFAVVLILFLWMVRTVIIAGFLGAVVAAYLRPIYHWLRDRLPSKGLGALLAILLLVGPLIGLLIYSYFQIAGFATFVAVNRDAISTQIEVSLRKLPLLHDVELHGRIGKWVAAASNYGASIPGIVRSAMSRIAVAT